MGVALSWYRTSMLYDEHISDTLLPLSPFQQQNIILQHSHTYHPPSPLLLPSSSRHPQWESASTTSVMQAIVGFTIKNKIQMHKGLQEQYRTKRNMQFVFPAQPV